MKIAQGSLEYLILIAVALAVISIVTLVSVNYLSGQQGQYSFTLCKNAAANCKVALAANPNDQCSSCDAACSASDGTEIFPDAPTCCKIGKPEFIYEGATGDDCTGCFDDSECTSPAVCDLVTHTCVTPACTLDSDCLYLNPTFCEKVTCEGEGASAHCVKETDLVKVGVTCQASACGAYTCLDINTRVADRTDYKCALDGTCKGTVVPGACINDCMDCQKCNYATNLCDMDPLYLCGIDDEGETCGYATSGCRCCIPLGADPIDITCMKTCIS